VTAYLTANGLQDITDRVDCSDNNIAEVKTIGQGTSGIVKRCPLTARGADGHVQRVAVKFFRRVSSDGSGEDECRALAMLPRSVVVGGGATNDAICPRSLLGPCGFVRYPLEEAIRLRVLPLAYPAAAAASNSPGNGDDKPDSDLVRAAQSEFFTFSEFRDDTTSADGG
jgi:hypothetical protein